MKKLTLKDSVGNLILTLIKQDITEVEIEEIKNSCKDDQGLAPTETIIEEI